MEHNICLQVYKTRQSQQGERGEDLTFIYLHYYLSTRDQILYAYLSHLNLTKMGTLTHLTDEGMEVEFLAINW